MPALGLRPDIRTRQPVKALWLVLVAAVGVVQLPFWLALAIVPAFRPRRGWSWRQTVSVWVMKFVLRQISTVRMTTALPLSHGGARQDIDRFAVIPAPEPALFVGPATADCEIGPTAIGATWHPRLPAGDAGRRPAGPVVLHFHGGAFVVGNDRSAESRFLASAFLRDAGAGQVLCPQYRLASNSGGRYPAALQDAITAYAHLLHDRAVAPADIVLSGDSAGGNLVLALLRYVAEYGCAVGLPPPACAWLWSTWTYPAGSVTSDDFEKNVNASSDYLPSNFGQWGVRALCGGVYDPDDPYISPLNHPFATKTPVFIQTGDAEALCHENIRLMENFRSVKGNTVGFWLQPDAVHDILYTAPLLGFRAEARECARRAGNFLKKHKER